MIIDTSAILAILRQEPGARECSEAIARAVVRRISAANLLEAAIVVDGSGDPIASRRLDELLAASGIATEPVTAEQAHLGRAAFRDFGRGSGHPARLSFGDCFAYALAKTAGEPLLFTGRDFARTDVVPAIGPPGP
jgi:ribonuclease VapC